MILISPGRYANLGDENFSLYFYVTGQKFEKSGDLPFGTKGLLRLWDFLTSW